MIIPYVHQRSYGSILRFCLEALYHSSNAVNVPIEVFISTSDQNTSLPILEPPESVLLHSIRAKSPYGAAFNKSFLLNRAYCYAKKNSKLLLLDADILVSPEALLQGYVDLEVYDASYLLTRLNSEAYAEYAGGCVFVTAEGYHTAGGSDETFVNYGNEDVDLYDRLVETCKVFRANGSAGLNLLEMPHRTSAINPANRAYYERLRQQSKREREDRRLELQQSLNATCFDCYRKQEQSK